MKKIFTLLFASLLGLAALFVFGGCAPTAKTVSGTWQLDYYYMSGVKYSTQFDEMDYFKPVPRDVVKLELRKDETFTFTDYRGTVSEGTYDVRRVKVRTWYTEVNLHTENSYYFSSGTFGSGKGGKTLSLYRNGVDYYFVEKLERDWGNVIEEGLAREGERLKGFEQGGGHDYEGLSRGEVTFEDGVRFLTVYNDYGEIRHYALDDCTAYFYDYDAEYMITPGTYREGECAVKHSGRPGSRTFAIHYKV